MLFLLASDYPMPKVDFKIFKEKNIAGNFVGFMQGFAVDHCDYLKAETTEIAELISKQYIYDVQFPADISCIEDFKNYLSKNMEPNSEIEIWSIYLGGDNTKHYKIMPKLNNTSSNDLQMISDEMDYFKEHNFEPERRVTSVISLSKEDVSFFLNNTGACLSIRNISKNA